MTQLGPGRPRLAPRRRQGQTPRAEILDAAAELFTTHGYGSTSTRAIAEAVGIRQASLYHHFGAKDDILDALLGETIAAAAELAERLGRRPEPATVRLYTLARFDIGQLCEARWNIGALYFLPELHGERFTRFRSRRDALRTSYEKLAAQVVAGAGEAIEARTLPFRLVETVINIRSDAGGVPEETRRAIAEAVLRVLGVGDDLAGIREAAEILARELRV
ncbi:TetR/AcrR family transcriptional regulator [Nocardia jinanensis]|uniref:TetR family transcriptional regulator n=1 Tax=Nocardia jinanensis TaxID=382504 RepID=A0A917VQ21_9NOCA|nr:TetR/AcrR family transcriptional regulator [Nocardia jinanensis]GGL06556.1 TetR family transcriptional regulator [Nocardia jinanensis]